MLLSKLVLLWLEIGGDILVTGGGAKHQFLMDRIAFHAKQNLTIPELQIVDFKEAIIFAFFRRTSFKK